MVNLGRKHSKTNGNYSKKMRKMRALMLTEI
jgi:hypothetical protein